MSTLLSLPPSLTPAGLGLLALCLWSATIGSVASALFVASRARRAAATVAARSADRDAAESGRALIRAGVAAGQHYTESACPGCGDRTGLLSPHPPDPRESRPCRKCGARIFGG